jgi:membrane-associated protease RseP (regulator of RpoE activity)
MGSALMVLVAFLMTRVPIVKHRPNMMAQSIATPALKASTPMDQEDLISTLVIVPDSDIEEASSAGPGVRTDVLEERIRDTLKLRAFTDIGVSVSKKGDAYLAGEVYSLDEAHKIARIVHRVNGVSRVHFMHPDVHPAQGPAYFGVMMAFAPDVWGAKVRAVIIGSPADKAGLAPGDVISEFDGKTIPDAKTLNDLIAQYSPGKRVQFRAWHNGQPEYLVARFGETTTVASREMMTVAGREIVPVASDEVTTVASRDNMQVASREIVAPASGEITPVAYREPTRVASR